MKSVVYGGTRNIYQHMIPAINSVLQNGGIDKVYVLAEDDWFPHPDVEVINVRDHPFKDSPNAHKRWSYIILMKACLPYLIPLDKVLWLDYDTIVERDISGLWDIDMTDYYFAGVREPRKSAGGDWYRQPLYINAGVLMCNLEKLRDGKADEIIKALQEKEYSYPEQDCINELCQGHILKIGGRYNYSDFTEYDTDAVIYHFATYEPNDLAWQLKAKPYMGDRHGKL
ncbi:MAG: hypothetical protein J6V08_04640 [Candidatus Methanomethylophilaceae archaeon]|nr:hypothetical protein [Candidatus Methanomethylophilaceae archaeon]